MKIDQPTAQPTNKVTAVGIGGALATVLIYVAGQFGIELTPEVAGAVVVIVAFVSGYFTRNEA